MALPSPALQGQAALRCAPPDSGAHRRDCHAALGAREEARRGGDAAFPIRTRTNFPQRAAALAEETTVERSLDMPRRIE
jgi:hypothetical protein